MAELKTKVTKASVAQFINAIDDEQRRKDCKSPGGDDGEVDQEPNR